MDFIQVLFLGFCVEEELFLMEAGNVHVSAAYLPSKMTAPF